MTSKTAAPTPQTSAGLVPYALLTVLVVAVFARMLGHELVEYDTDVYVLQNEVVKRGLTWDGVRWAWTGFHLGNYHPITWLAHMLDVSLFGLWAPGHLSTNLALHVANTLLVFHLARQFGGRTADCLFVAALFGIHPQHVEPVAWLAERKELLSTLFGLLALVAWLAWTRHARRRHYVLALVAFVSALLCKPMLVSLPVVLVLLDRFVLGRRGWRLGERAPFVALSATACWLAIAAQSAAGAVATTTEIPLSLRLENALVSTVAYLQHTFVPASLAFTYPYPEGGIASESVGLAVVVLVALGIVSWRWKSARGWFAMGYLSFLVTLLPVLGLVQVGQQARADRFTYVPLLGIFVIVAGLMRWLGRWGNTLAIAAVLVLATLSFQQVGTWKDTLTMAEHAAHVTERNAIAWNMYGWHLAQRGEADPALAALRLAADCESGTVAHANLANLLQSVGRPDEAEAIVRRRLATHAGDGRLCLRLGILLVERNAFAEAVAPLELALRATPEVAGPWLYLGEALEGTGNWERSRQLFTRAAELEPRWPRAHANLGRVLLDEGQVDKARAHIEFAALTETRNAYFWHQAARQLWLDGAEADCVLGLRQSLSLRPDAPLVLAALGLVLGTSRDPAVFQAESASVYLAQAVATAAPDLRASLEDVQRALNGCLASSPAAHERRADLVTRISSASPVRAMRGTLLWNLLR